MDLEAIKKYFTRFKCSRCQEAFAIDGIKILTCEKGYYAIKIDCLECENSFGIVILSLPEAPVEKLPVKKDVLPPISREDVEKASQFIHSLGADWMKYIPIS